MDVSCFAIIPKLDCFSFHFFGQDLKLSYLYCKDVLSVEYKSLLNQLLWVWGELGITIFLKNLLPLLISRGKVYVELL